MFGGLNEEINPEIGRFSLSLGVRINERSRDARHIKEREGRSTSGLILNLL